MSNRREFIGAVASLLLPFPLQAQSFPTKPIRYIVPVAAGGGNDMIARVVTERWGRVLGQTFVVENQSGGELTANLILDGEVGQIYPLVPGSSPGEPTRKANPHQQWWEFCLLSVTLSSAQSAGISLYYFSRILNNSE